MTNGYAVGGQMHVALDGELLVAPRRANGRQRVLQTFLFRSCAAMRDRPLGQPGNLLHGLRRSPSDGFHLDGGVERERGHADGRAGVLAALAQRRGQEVGGTVGHEVLLGEVGRRGDEDGDLDHAGAIFSRSPSAALAWARMLMAQSLAASLPVGGIERRGRAGRWPPAACRP